MPKLKQREADKTKELTAYKRAVRLKCLDCMNNTKEDCIVPDCSLYPWMPYKNKK